MVYVLTVFITIKNLLFFTCNDFDDFLNEVKF